MKKFTISLKVNSEDMGLIKLAAELEDEDFESYILRVALEGAARDIRRYIIAHYDSSEAHSEICKLEKTIHDIANSSKKLRKVLRTP